MRLFSVTIHTYFYSNFALHFFETTDECHLVPKIYWHLISWVFPFHTHEHIYRDIYIEIFFLWNICQMEHCTFTLWNSPVPNLSIILSSKDQGKENIKKNMQCFLLWLLPKIMRDMQNPVSPCSWCSSACYFPLPTQIFPILIKWVLMSIP